MIYEAAMKEKRTIKYLLMIGVVLNMVAISGCGQFLNAAVGSTASSAEQTDAVSEAAQYEITDTDRRTDADNGIEINLSELTADSETDHYSYREGCLTISGGGAYIICGKTNLSRIIVRAYDDEVVHLIFDAVELRTAGGPAVYVEQAGKAVITLKEGTENIISDGVEYTTNTEACIFSNCDITINGKGSLSVYGYYHDAIRSKDRVKVIATNLYVRAKNDGIRGNDGVLIQDSSVEVESEKTGILTNSEQGYVVIQGGFCKVTSGENAVFADNYVSIHDCESDLYSVKEAVKCNGVKDTDE